MPSYNGSKIIKSADAIKSVSDYSAKKIKKNSPNEVDVSNSFTAEYRGEASSFRMDELLKERTGMAGKRQQEVMDKVEQTVIEKLKDVEQDAYEKAYELGFEEGTAKGLKNAEEMVSEKLAGLDQVLAELHQVRKAMIIENESAIVQMCYHFASKIAIRNIEEDPNYIMECVSNLMDSMQSDSKINLKVSFEDFDFIEQFKDRDLKTKDLFSNIKVFKEDSLSNGECIFESNHGLVNASIPERLDKLWATLSVNLPKTDGLETVAVALSEEVAVETLQVTQEDSLGQDPVDEIIEKDEASTDTSEEEGD